MEIEVNGLPVVILQPCDLLAFLQDPELIAMGISLDDLTQIVVAVNMHMIHIDDYDKYEVQSGDRIDILSAVVGG